MNGLPLSRFGPSTLAPVSRPARCPSDGGYAWRPLLEAAETRRLLLPILVHIPAPGIEGHIAELPASAGQHLAGAYHHIPTAIAALHDLRHRSAAERRTSPRRH